MIALTGLALVVSLKHGGYSGKMRYVSYYIAAAFLIDCASIYSHFGFSASNNHDAADDLLSSIFSIVEITFLYLFLYNNINGYNKRSAMKLIYSIFALFIFYLCVTKRMYILKMPNQVYALESICLVVASLFYFHGLFTTSKLFVLKKHPSFWVVTGILLYHGCCVPIYLLINFVNHHLPLYVNFIPAFNYLLYCILFILFMKAYLCRKNII